LEKINTNFWKQTTMKPSSYFFFIFLSFGFYAQAQSDGGGSYLAPAQFWGEVVLTQPFAKKWVSQLDLQYNTSNDQTKNYQILEHTVNYGGRIWAHYYYKPNIKISTTFGAWINTEVPEIKQKADVEYRTGIQFQHYIKRGRATIYNRFRWEDRFISLLGENNFSHTSRFRYMPKLFVSVNSKSIREKSLYWILSNEFLFNVNKGSFLDQNRICTGFGYCFTDNISLELTYVNRFNNSSSSPNEFTQALSASISFNNFTSWFKKNN
jgi:hypothetical protein